MTTPNSAATLTDDERGDLEALRRSLASKPHAMPPLDRGRLRALADRDRVSRQGATAALLRAPTRSELNPFGESR